VKVKAERDRESEEQRAWACDTNILKRDSITIPIPIQIQTQFVSSRFAGWFLLD